MTPDFPDVLAQLMQRWRAYDAHPVDDTIAPHDDMYQAQRRPHYFAVGRSAVVLIATTLLKARSMTVGSVLDCPCGSGRVLRHLVRFLPEATFTACDLFPPHVDFCQKQFGATPILSMEDLREITMNRSFDLVWCGSLLTHLPAAAVQDGLRAITDWLAPGGLALITLHGRWPLVRQATTSYKYMGDEVFTPITEGVAHGGFGYADYPNLYQRVGQAHFGISVSLPSWVLRTIEAWPEVRLLDYIERGWDNHQDVLVLRKTAISAKPWIFEESL